MSPEREAARGYRNKIPPYNAVEDAEGGREVRLDPWKAFPASGRLEIRSERSLHNWPIPAQDKTAEIPAKHKLPEAHCAGFSS